MFSQENFENDPERQVEEDEESEESYTKEEYLIEDQPEEVNPDRLEESNPEAGGIDYDPFTDDEAGPSPSPQREQERSKAKRRKCEKLFSLECSFCQRLYRSQLRPKENFSAQISGDSVQEVVANMWESGKSLIKREVRFENGVPKWASGEIPGEESAEKFLIVYAHKSYATTNLTSKKLQKWRDQIVKVFVYAYSKEVETKGQYGDVLKYLINPKNPDRAGANSMREEAALAKELREKNPHLEGHSSSWLLWATTIHAAPAHEQEALKEAQHPPINISKYFRWVGVSEAALLDSVHRGMVVANTVNSRWSKQIREIKEDLHTAFNIIQGAIRKVETMEAESNASIACDGIGCATRGERVKPTVGFGIDHI
ncbi:uncharacterized protein LOC120426045 [Culex pipiens pallens]|uniref:uncharacterized protein LOC120426045 n=1 Tax=Culex pipiens pallens TaxID=42434 RepID=UPI00195495DC|nr:uncharacterized protein LOC120426045 [Culex pipiens pallens]